ncbi:MAG: cobalamin biosynthesis protein, partial [Nitrospirae bacterium]|nr:cobalamin biosynthesis protein [Nitrospirota bacterium]MCL5977029.1 cobalamin biosynthesis protein [Nitrospirota bacterium]
MTSGYSAFGLPPAILAAAFLLDIAVGDPRWLPHPVRIIGKAITKTEISLRKYFKSPLQEKMGGILLVIIVVGLTFGIASLIVYVIVGANTQTSALLRFCSVALMVYLTSTTIAVRELISSARLVIESAKNKDIESARSNLGMIVGRDTQNLSEKG